MTESLSEYNILGKGAYSRNTTCYLNMEYNNIVVTERKYKGSVTFVNELAFSSPLRESGRLLAFNFRSSNDFG